MTEPNSKDENLSETKNKYLNNLDVDYNVQEYKQSGTTKKRERAKPGYFLSFPLITPVLIIFVSSIILLFTIANIFREPITNLLQKQTDCRIFIKIMKKTGDPLSEAQVTFLSSDGKYLKEPTNAEGNLEIKVTRNSQIEILIRKNGFKTQISQLKTDVKEISKMIMLDEDGTVKSPLPTRPNNPSQSRN